jgi:hypothetical protein
MSIPENKTTAVRNPAEEDLPSAIETLRTMFHFAALCGIVLSASFYILIHKQVVGLKRQNEELASYVHDFTSNIAPKVEMTRTNLEAFGRTDPSIRPLLLKYFPATNAFQRP